MKIWSCSSHLGYFELMYRIHLVVLLEGSNIKVNRTVNSKFLYVRNFFKRCTECNSIINIYNIIFGDFLLCAQQFSMFAYLKTCLYMCTAEKKHCSQCISSCFYSFLYKFAQELRNCTAGLLLLML